MQKQNLAARAGRWSAQHRKKAVFGWLAFVIAAVFIGGRLGTKTIPSDEEGLTGDAKRVRRDRQGQLPADRGRAGPHPVQDREPEGPGLQRRRQGRREGRLAAQKDVTNIQSPYAKGNAGQISRDGHSSVVNFEIKGDSEKAQDKVDPILAATAAAQKAHPSSTSSSSATRAPARPSRRCSRTTSRRPRRSRSRSRS